MAKWICKSLQKQDQKILDLKRFFFQYMHSTKKTIDEDEPLMLKSIYDRINHSTHVGVCNLISSLFRFNLNYYNQDVPKMVDAFEATYNLILEKKMKRSNLKDHFLMHFLLLQIKILQPELKLNYQSGKVAQT